MYHIPSHAGRTVIVSDGERRGRREKRVLRGDQARPLTRVELAVVE